MKKNESKKSNKSKIIRNYIIALFVLLILVVIGYLIVINLPVNKRLRLIYNENKEGNIEIMPTNVTELFMDYEGSINQRSIYKAMYLFADEIVKSYYDKLKDYDDAQVKEYFSKNYNDIQRELRISDENEFISFSKMIKKLNNENIILQSYTINPETVKTEKDGVKFVLIINYENNPKIGFWLKIYNSSSDNEFPIKFDGNVEEELLDYEYIKPEYNNDPIDDIIKQDGKVV